MPGTMVRPMVSATSSTTAPSSTLVGNMAL